MGNKFLDTTCEICGLTFASVQSKVRHVGRLHPNDKDKIKTSYMKVCFLMLSC